MKAKYIIPLSVAFLLFIGIVLTNYSILRSYISLYSEVQKEMIKNEILWFFLENGQRYGKAEIKEDGIYFGGRNIPFPKERIRKRIRNLNRSIWGKQCPTIITSLPEPHPLVYLEKGGRIEILLKCKYEKNPDRIIKGDVVVLTEETIQVGEGKITIISYITRKRYIFYNGMYMLFTIALVFLYISIFTLILRVVKKCAWA